MSYEVGPQDECLNCGQSKASIRASQRRGGHHVIYCATVDYWGECEAEFDRHRFIWTAKDQAAEEAMEAHWEAMARAIGDEEREGLTP